MSTAFTLTGLCLIFSFFVIATQAHDELEKRAKMANIGPGVRMASFTQLNPNERKQVLDIHNRARQDVRGNNVLALEWDDDLGKLAQGLTDTCQYGHGNLVLPDRRQVAQNIGAGSSVAGLVQAFIDERDDYDMRSFRCRLADQDKCGHYVTAIWHSTNKVGCGVTTCPNLGLYLACNYQPGATSSGNPVSFGGAPCSKCNLDPGTSCDNGICRTCNTPGRPGCRRYDSSKCENSNTASHIDCKYMASQNRCKEVESVCEKDCKLCRS